MDKLDFITRHFNRTHNKKYENYVLTKIWHGINSTDVKMVMQQYVLRENGCALLDAYFPQFNIGIEVDEAHHRHVDTIILDEKREKDDIRAIGCEIYRVDVTQSIDMIHQSCDAIVNLIREKMSNTDFKPWNIVDEYSPAQYIDKGYISIEDNAAFRKQVDVLECFGIYYKSTWTGGEPHPVYEDSLIWFPKMHARKEWINIMDEDEKTIYESNEDPIKNKETIKLWLNEK